MLLSESINPLTTGDVIWLRPTLDAHYQLAQSVFKIGFALPWDKEKWVGHLLYYIVSTNGGRNFSLVAQRRSGNMAQGLWWLES